MCGMEWAGLGGKGAEEGENGQGGAEEEALEWERGRRRRGWSERRQQLLVGRKGGRRAAKGGRAVGEGTAHDTRLACTISVISM